jgi:DNA-3-methyladenine glycosylase II
MSPVTFEVAFEGPLDLRASLEIFRRSGDDMIDRFDGEWAVRTTRSIGRAVPYACRVAGDVEHPRLIVTAPNEHDREVVEQTVAACFLSLTPEFGELCERDPVIGRLARLHRGFRPVMQTDLLGALVRCVSAQQVNLKWASTVRRRLAESFGRGHRIGEHVVYSLDAERIAALEIDDIRALQFTNRKSEYIINVARAVANNELSIAHLSTLADDEAIARITAIRGLGLWTAEWILARTLGRPRLSVFDLGVRKAIGKIYFRGQMPSPEEVREATAHWGGASAMAQGLILHAQHERTLEAEASATSIKPLAAKSPRRARLSDRERRAAESQIIPRS